jgi:hypothetical protein
VRLDGEAVLSLYDPVVIDDFVEVAACEGDGLVLGFLMVDQYLGDDAGVDEGEAE